MLNTYDAKGVTVIVGGSLISGFSEDAMVTVSADGGEMKLVKGSEGEVARVLGPSKAAHINLHLLQSSPSNAMLWAYVATDRISPNSGGGGGTFSVQIKDLSNGLLHHGAICWIMHPPTVPYGKSIAVIEWDIQVAELITETQAGIQPVQNVALVQLGLLPSTFHF